MHLGCVSHQSAQWQVPPEDWACTPEAVSLRGAQEWGARAGGGSKKLLPCTPGLPYIRPASAASRTPSFVNPGSSSPSPTRSSWPRPSPALPCPCLALQAPRRRSPSSATPSPPSRAPPCLSTRGCTPWRCASRSRSAWRARSGGWEGRQGGAVHGSVHAAAARTAVCRHGSACHWPGLPSVCRLHRLQADPDPPSPPALPGCPAGASSLS